MTKEEILIGKMDKAKWFNPDMMVMGEECAKSVMQAYADQQQIAALTKFKADAIYCNGTGIKDMDINYYLNVELR